MPCQSQSPSLPRSDHHGCYHDAMNDIMERTTITLPKAHIKRLKILAAERGISMAALIREAVEATLTKERPKPKSIGIFDSGRTDISQLASEGPVPPVSWH